jgi:hypothetical protein
MVPLLSAAHTAAYLLDLLNTKVDGKNVLAPDVPGEHKDAAREMIELIEGKTARMGLWLLWRVDGAAPWQGLPRAVRRPYSRRRALEQK